MFVFIRFLPGFNDFSTLLDDGIIGRQKRFYNLAYNFIDYDRERQV